MWCYHLNDPNIYLYTNNTSIFANKKQSLDVGLDPHDCFNRFQNALGSFPHQYLMSLSPRKNQSYIYERRWWPWQYHISNRTYSIFSWKRGAGISFQLQYRLIPLEPTAQSIPLFSSIFSSAFFFLQKRPLYL